MRICQKSTFNMKKSEDGPVMYLQNKRSLFPVPPAHFHPLPSMNIPDRKSSPKPDMQFHKSTSISCHPIEAEKGHVRWNPDLLRE